MKASKPKQSFFKFISNTWCGSLVALSLCLSNVSFAYEKVCPISKEEEHKALYEKYKMPELKSVFDDCGFGDLLDFSNVTDAIFDKLKKKASKATQGIGFCGFTTRDVWDMYGTEYQFPADEAKEVIDDLEDKLDKSVEKIEFPITSGATQTTQSTKSKKNKSKLYDLIFGGDH